MGKRLIRINVTQLTTDTALFLGKQGSIVLKNGSVFVGIFLKYEQSILQLQDFGHQIHFFNLDEINELVLDQIATY